MNYVPQSVRLFLDVSFQATSLCTHLHAPAINAAVPKILSEVDCDTRISPSSKQSCEGPRASGKEDIDHDLTGTICETAVVRQEELDMWVEPTLALTEADGMTHLYR